MLEIEVRVRRKGVKSMTYDFTFRIDGQEVASGRMTSVCCEVRPDRVRGIPIPPAIADHIEEPPT
jgi:acyl-CoA thioesterase FadM